MCKLSEYCITHPKELYLLPTEFLNGRLLLPDTKWGRSIFQMKIQTDVAPLSSDCEISIQMHH